MSGNIYRLRRIALPTDLASLLNKLLTHTERGHLTGLAFVAILDGHGYVSEVAGSANEDIGQTRLLLKAFDAKLAKRQLGTRSGEGEP